MADPTPVTVLCTYRPHPGKEAEFFKILEVHWPTLRRLGLVTEQRPTLYRATDKRNKRTYFVEIFQWTSEDGSLRAHQHPEVGKLWGPMMPLLESMSFDHIERIG
jgi:hypothetical protein